MTVELYYLTLSAELAAILWIPYIMAFFVVWGIVPTLSYPADPPELPAWAQRSQRAHLNLLECLAPFAVLVIAAHLLDVSTSNSVLGATLFF